MSKITVFQMIHALSGVADPNEAVTSLDIGPHGSIRLNGRDIMASDEAVDLEDPLGRDMQAVDLCDGIELWTDGACAGNPGPGGWAFCVVQGGRLIEEKGGYHPETTNNRMEMQALIEGLNRLHPGATVTVKTDSQLIVNTITQGWKRKANRDLWSEIDAALDRHHRVTFEHVKGHNGEEWNERVDRLAVGQYQACR
jgi:ribonuclease HI